MRKLFEVQLNRADTKAIFKKAVSDRNTPKGPAKYIKSLRKPTIDAAELQKAWADAGFPDDTRDIEGLLLAHGFSKPEVKKIFVQVFGEDPTKKGEFDEPETSPAVQKIADYARQNGLEKDLIAFLEKEYGFTESVHFHGKAVVEDIREIFTSIVKEERLGRAELVKEHENTQLGRSKK